MKLWKQQMLLQHIALWELEVQKEATKQVINFQKGVIS